MLAILPLWVWIFGAVIVTSAISGVFGMAGGLILMLILAQFVAVAPAMVLHGVTQFVSNGWRAVLWRRWIVWRIVGLYALGAAPAILLPVLVAYVPDKATMLILLGTVPYAALALPEAAKLDAARPAHAVACGFFVAGTQLLAGVAGPLLDVFFVRTNLTRHQVVATKAVCAATGHIGKLVYFGALLGGGTAGLPAWLPGALIVAAILGTALGKRVLDGLTDSGFRRWSRVIILTLGAVYLAQAAWLMLRPAG